MGQTGRLKTKYSIIWDEWSKIEYQTFVQRMEYSHRKRFISNAFQLQMPLRFIYIRANVQQFIEKDE